jgi:hypothetical protein
MSDLTRKLGIKAGSRVGLLNAEAETVARLRETSPPGVTFQGDSDQGKFDLILFWPDSLHGLKAVFQRLQQEIDPDGAVWAVIPKKKFAPSRGIDFTWEELLAAGLQSDLVDNKVVSVSEQTYATRFVIRKERRWKYREAI